MLQDDARALTAEQIHTRTETRWSFTGVLPEMVEGWWRCGACAGTLPHIQRWGFHHYTDADIRPHRIPWRCNVEVKCTQCGLVTCHGIVIREEYYRLRARLSIRWQDAAGLTFR